jgi:hypothetical protein
MPLLWPLGSSRQRLVVDAFLAAARAGDFDALVALLGSRRRARVRRGGRPDGFAGGDPGLRCRGRNLLRSGAGGSAGAHRRRRRRRVGRQGAAQVAWDLTISDGKIVHIDMLAAGDSLDVPDLIVLDD